tara:strand:+ start:225 stop:935 length:711 start_codon:yes stop_codon:yes gene_type:complete
MSDAQVAKFDPNFKEQQKVKEKPKNNDGCVTADDLNKKLNVSKFNKMMEKTQNTMQQFLSSYIKKQTDVIDNRKDLEYDRYRQTAINEKRILIDKHTNMMNELNKIYQFLKNAILSEKNTADLHKMLTNQNNKLLKEEEKQRYNIEIADRKTYYENKQNTFAQGLSDFLDKNYIYFILSLVIAAIIVNRYKDKKLMGTILALALYPYIAFILLDIVSGIYNWIKGYTKWVYLYKNM